MVFSTVRKPWFWLAAQAVGLALVLGLLGWFSPRGQPDTASYAEFPLQDAAAALRHIRTLGYPLFLRAADCLGGSHAAAPWGHYVIHVAAVFVFFGGLSSILRSPWGRLAAASSLLYSNVLLRYGSAILADSLASSLAILALGLLLMLTGRRRGALPWLGFTLALSAVYHTRPAYLFLPFLAPPLAILIEMLARRWPDRRGRIQSGAAWCAASLLPLLGFCLVRWLLVGQFGLVSFGGYNFIGVVGQFLTPELVSELPEDSQPLARAALDRWEQLETGDGSPPWRAPLRYSTIQRRFDRMTWEVFEPAARRLYGGDCVRINRGFLELGTAIVRARPALYAVWYLKAFGQGLRVMAGEIVMNPVYLLLLAFLAAAHACHVAQRLRREILLEDFDADYFTGLNCLLLVAVGFGVAQLLLVAATTPPVGRFMDAAGVFLPTVPAAVLANRLERCVRYRQLRFCGEKGP